MNRLLLPLIICVTLCGSLRAQIVISEIHYHPVEEPAFNADGSPVLDISDDVHEFVEIPVKHSRSRVTALPSCAPGRR
jgi:hypothetical protein